MAALPGAAIALSGRRAFLTVVSGALIACRTAAAQPSSTVKRVGLLSGATVVVGHVILKDALRDLGWLDGQNFILELRAAGGRYDRLPDLAADLVRLKVDVIVAQGSAASVAARDATRTIPIVMVSVGDPVGLGLVKSLARPGGNATGLAFSGGTGRSVKALGLLKEAVPRVRRIAVLANAAHPNTAPARRALTDAARSLKVELQILEVRGPGEFDAAFAAMARGRAEALFVVTEAMFNDHRARLVELATQRKLPSMYGEKVYVEAGGLMSYGPSIPAMMQRAGALVDRILKGAQPGVIPVEEPATFEMAINLKPARALQLAIPPSLLAQAERVIE